jgi:hypothetical protein
LRWNRRLRLQADFIQQQLGYIASDCILLDYEGRGSAPSGIGYMLRGHDSVSMTCFE